jgi:hypothetical protein
VGEVSELSGGTTVPSWVCDLAVVRLVQSCAHAACVVNGWAAGGHVILAEQLALEASLGLPN